MFIFIDFAFFLVLILAYALYYSSSGANKNDIVQLEWKEIFLETQQSLPSAMIGNITVYIRAPGAGNDPPYELSIKNEQQQAPTTTLLTLSQLKDRLTTLHTQKAFTNSPPSIAADNNSWSRDLVNAVHLVDQIWSVAQGPLVVPTLPASPDISQPSR